MNHPVVITEVRFSSTQSKGKDGTASKKVYIPEPNQAKMRY